MDKAQLIISTIPDIEDNILLLKGINYKDRRVKIIVMAYEASEAKALYKHGADYVILPHLAGGRQIAEILRDNDLSELPGLKKKDLAYL